MVDGVDEEGEADDVGEEDEFLRGVVLDWFAWNGNRRKKERGRERGMLLT